MRLISRTALGAATAAVLAVTAVPPSAAQPQDAATADRTEKSPLVGSSQAAGQEGRTATVTLVTGDKVLVSTDGSGRTAATALPREDGTLPFVQTRRAGEVTLRWKATAKSPYLYNLAFPETGRIGSDRTYRVRDGELAEVEATYHAMGVATDFFDSTAAYRPVGSAVYFGGTEFVPVPGKRTEFYSAGDTAWDHLVGSSFPFGELMADQQRTYRKGQSRSESWYDGVVAPVAPRDTAGKRVLAAERQGNLIGFASAMWGDSGHFAHAGGFGDIGNLVLRRDGEEIGRSAGPFGVFEVPAEDSPYELEQFVLKIGSPARVWQRCQSVKTVWKFRSKLDESAYSQGLGVLFPGYDLPEDGLKTLPAADGQLIGLRVSGQAGYTPATLNSAKLSYSYDKGETWTEAKASQRDGRWTATVDHAGAAGKQVTLRSELTDAKGNSVTQTVVRAYDVR
ncbi:hypothetical protein NLX86_22775 [Streptomyces sp. A3M-1-3]|uniref:hypothetical protein n=1 Tax=Streptomyces sp. A3M-1-3 TaxID=2962044 RepID=UPI0020B6E71F|nr:hypothetical protein [Streptomyces sp. A3M-1-3]MCP3820816.1 hypothetical protein [Streptomyces sp. A3M-1-3]